MSYWVIESARTEYWNGHGVRVIDFEPDITKAIRFSRFEDAETIRCWLMERFYTLLRSTEHLDIPPTATEEPR